MFVHIVSSAAGVPPPPWHIQVDNLAPDIWTLRGFTSVFGPLLSTLVATLFTAFVSLASAYIFFYRIPRKNKQLETTIALVREYNSEVVQGARREAWAYIRLSETPAENMTAFCSWIALSAYNGGENVATFQKIGQVLTFFAVLEMHLDHKLVDEAILEAGMGWSYESWRRWVIVPARVEILKIKAEHQASDPSSVSRRQPRWCTDLERLNAIVSESSVSS